MVATVGNMASSEYYLTSQQGYKDPSKYYTTGQEPDGVWWNPKAMFDLKDGAVIESEAFLRLYNGFAPDTGEKLTRNAGLADRSPGKDVHFAPDKTVSAVWALADDQLRSRLEKAHNGAVRKALNTIVSEYCSTVRTGTNGINVVDADVMAAMFQHGDSREGDPQLHTHVTLFNFGRFVDDKTGEYAYRAHHAGTLYDWKMAIGSVYRNALAWELRHEIGFDIEQYGKNNELFRIKGVPDELTSLWSKRRKQIVREALDQGYTTAQAPERAAGANKVTRKSKVFESDPAARFDRWHSEADNVLNREQFIDHLLAFDNSVSEERIEAVKDGLSAIPSELTQNEAVFHLKDLIRATANHTSGVIHPDQIAELSKTILSQENVEKLPRPKYGYGRARGEESRVYTTTKELNEEAEIVAYGAKLRELDGYALEPTAVRQFIDHQRHEFGITYTKEQLRAVGVATIKSNGIARVDGAAGSGKSFALRPAAQLYLRNGFKVYATADAWRQAQELGSDCGVPPFSFEKLLRDAVSHRLVVDDKTVIIVDEYSQQSVRATHRLVKLASERGAKVIFTGEKIQGQAVEAGAGVRLLIDAGIMNGVSAEITTIRRQRPDVEDLLVYGEGVSRDTALLRAQLMTTEEAKSVRAQFEKTYRGEPWKVTASHHFREQRAYEGLLEYGKRQKVHFAADHDARMKTIVGDWHAYVQNEGPSAVILARTNAEVNEISQYARELILPPSNQRREFELRVARGDNINPVSRTLSIAVGDMIKVGRLMEHLQLVNGSIVEVTALEERRDQHGRDRLHITGRVGHGREVAFYADESCDFFGNVRLDYGYARTMTSAQGMTEDKVFAFADEFLARESAYPAFTRHRQDMEIYFNRKALSMAVRERLPEDQYDRVITDDDLYKYLGEMMSRDGQKANALDYYEYVDEEKHDYRIERDALLQAAKERIEERAHIAQQLPEIAYPRQLRLDGLADRPYVNNELVNKAVRELVRFNSSFNKTDAQIWFARNGIDQSDLEAHYHALSCHSLVLALDGPGNSSNPYFTTVDTLAEERRLMDLSDVLLSRTRTVHNADVLSDIRALTDRLDLDARRGEFLYDTFAGSGLSILRSDDRYERMQVVRGMQEYAVQHREKVYALGVTRSDMDELQGLSRYVGHVEGFLYGIANDRKNVDGSHIVVVNGSEKLDNTSLTMLLEASNRRGFKLVLMGNENSVQSFGRNGGFGHLADKVGATGTTRDAAALENLSPYQQDLTLKDYSSLLGRMDRNGDIQFTSDAGKVYRALNNTLDRAEFADEIAIVTKSTAERHVVNDEIQKLRKAENLLGDGIELFVGVERSAPIDGVERYFAPDDAKQKFVQTHRISVHVGDVVVMRQSDHKRGFYNGQTGTVESVSSESIRVASTVNGQRTTFEINPREFRAFDLGYARSPMDLQKHGATEVHAIASAQWRHNDLYSLWTRDNQQVRLYCTPDVAINHDDLRERFAHSQSKAFVGNTMTRIEQHRLDRERGIADDPRYSELSDIEKAYLERLDAQRHENFVEARREILDIFDGSVPQRFANDNAGGNPRGFEKLVANLSAAFKQWRGPAVDPVDDLSSSMKAHVTLMAECRKWAADQNASLYAAPRANELINNLEHMAAIVRTLDSAHGDVAPRLAAAGIDSARVEALMQAHRDHVAGARIHALDNFRALRTETVSFARAARVLHAEYAQMSEKTGPEAVWSHPDYLHWEGRAKAVIEQGRGMADDFHSYRPHLPEVGITRKSMLNSMTEDLDANVHAQRAELERRVNALDPVDALNAVDVLRRAALEQGDTAKLNALAGPSEDIVRRCYEAGRFEEVEHLAVFDTYATRTQKSDPRAWNSDPWTIQAREQSRNHNYDLDRSSPNRTQELDRSAQADVTRTRGRDITQ